MPSLDLPAALVPQANKIQARFITLDRMPSFGCPLVRVVIVSGYYEVDSEGAPVPNALGFPRFTVRDTLLEFEVPLNDPQVQQIMAAREVEFKTYVITHPDVPLMVTIDNYLTQLALDLYDAKYLHPVTVEAEAPVVILPEVTP